MPRFKNYNDQQTTMVLISFEDQITEGTLEFAIHYLLENEIDLSVFAEKFSNDETGCPAWHRHSRAGFRQYSHSETPGQVYDAR